VKGIHSFQKAPLIHHVFRISYACVALIDEEGIVRVSVPFRSLEEIKNLNIALNKRNGHCCINLEGQAQNRYLAKKPDLFERDAKRSEDSSVV
jgi:hypothetical protein